MEVYKYKIEVQMSDTSGQPGKSPAPEAKPEGREFLDEGSKEDLLADTQVIRRSLESRLDKLREEKKWAEQCNTQLEIDLDKIKKRYNALESDFEAMVLEKELKIHELKDSLKLAQIRCHQLEPENVHQQQYITQLEARQATLEHTNAQLNRHMKEIVAEISSLKNNKSRVGLICQDDFVTLQKKLEERNKELLLLIEHEHETLNTVATLYEEKTRLQLRLVQMEQKWGAVKQYLAKSYLQLQQNIHPFISKRDALRLELDRHKGLLVAAQTEVNRLTQLQQRRRQAKLEPENCRCGQGDIFDVELQLDDSLTLQTLCALTPTVDISTTQQSLPTGLKRNAEQFMAFIKQQEKQGANSDATPTHSNKKHFC